MGLDHEVPTSTGNRVEQEITEWRVRRVVQVKFGLLENVEERLPAATEATPKAKHRNWQYLLNSLPRYGEVDLSTRAACDQVEYIEDLPHVHTPALEVFHGPVPDGSTQLYVGKQHLRDAIIAVGQKVFRWAPADFVHLPHSVAYRTEVTARIEEPTSAFSPLTCLWHIWHQPSCVALVGSICLAAEIATLDRWQRIIGAAAELDELSRKPGLRAILGAELHIEIEGVEEGAAVLDVPEASPILLDIAAHWEGVLPVAA
ncbi:hypothetical protein [Polyangium aurulentum]|uniref:hypothetical protein n=1 Tax=Polyangium aurulentum TaxID=2567896 RepID=UPI0010AE2C28|nr:hypothetical protein [Polyangium aurulentum]UQA56386.1 hypothetical protein E8A73_034470 [Polyangium aurulentum]